MESVIDENKNLLHRAVQEIMKMINLDNLKDFPCGMKVVESTSKDYDIISKYVKNTHGECDDFRLRIIDILRLERKGESQKFAADLGNRCLLWHGSRRENFNGILRLCVSPPTVNGSSKFGKGVYFTDMVSKSAHYTGVRFGEEAENEGLLLLCDVALGKVEERQIPSFDSTMKEGCTSIKGLGKWGPQENLVEVDDEGCKVVFGPAVEAQEHRPLLHNEYIVYNADQIRLRYLVRVAG